MKIFVSYAFTGEDYAVLRVRLTGLKNLFDQLGFSYYINCFAPGWQEMTERKATGGEFLQFALKDMQTSDIVFVIQASERRSEGMLMEVGAAVVMGKKIILAQHVSSKGKTYLDTVANDTFTWRTEEEFLGGAKEYFSAMR